MRGIMAAAIVFLAASMYADEAIYIRIPGIQGTSSDPSHPKWIEASDFGFDAGNPLGASKTTLKATFKKVADAKSSPALFNALTQSRQFEEIQVDFQKTLAGSQHVYLSIMIRDAEIVEYSLDYTDDQAEESIDLKYKGTTLRFSTEAGEAVEVSSAGVP
ncbi:MAG: type VI secretion system tube protein Hcp [Acidobacteriota bacterium]